ncbi:hypothetical protein GCM10027418_11960 [Mariniluteicoccus endophyticus]
MSDDLSDDLPTHAVRPGPDGPESPDGPGDPAPPRDAGSAILARGLRLTGDRGPVFGPLDLDLPYGGLAVLAGPEGSGRTCLLLTLCGRMAPTAGDLVVLDHHLPRGRRTLHKESTLAHFAGIDDLDEGLTVHEVLAERAGLITPLWRRPPATDDEGIQEICRPVFGTRTTPPANEKIWHLAPLDVTLLQISLALMGRPRLLVVDDIDTLTDPDEQRVVWDGLARVARTAGTTVVAASTTVDAVPPEARAYALATGEHLDHHSPTHAI